jgi:hypothetical protein
MRAIRRAVTLESWAPAPTDMHRRNRSGSRTSRGIEPCSSTKRSRPTTRCLRANAVSGRPRTACANADTRWSSAGRPWMQCATAGGFGPPVGAKVRGEMPSLQSGHHPTYISTTATGRTCALRVGKQIHYICNGTRWMRNAADTREELNSHRRSRRPRLQRVSHSKRFWCFQFSSRRACR